MILSYHCCVALAVQMVKAIRHLKSIRLILTYRFNLMIYTNL